LVLVESFEPGTHIERFTREDISPDVRQTIASVGMDAFLKMMLVDNFVHADLHPGNILVDEGRDGSNSSPQVVLLDVGLITQLSEKDRENFLKLFSAVVAGDADLVGHLITDGQDHLTPQVVQQFSAEVATLMAKVKLTRLDEVPLSEIFFEMLSIARKNKVILEANFTTLIIGTVVIEGLGRQLDPDLNLLQRAVPLLVKDRAIRDAYIKARLSARLPSLFRQATSVANP
jgi:aarF domain-containing kinase